MWDCHCDFQLLSLTERNKFYVFTSQFFSFLNYSVIKSFILAFFDDLLFWVKRRWISFDLLLSCFLPPTPLPRLMICLYENKKIRSHVIVILFEKWLSQFVKRNDVLKWLCGGFIPGFRLHIVRDQIWNDERAKQRKQISCSQKFINLDYSIALNVAREKSFWSPSRNVPCHSL